MHSDFYPFDPRITSSFTSQRPKSQKANLPPRQRGAVQKMQRRHCGFDMHLIYINVYLMVAPSILNYLTWALYAYLLQMAYIKHGFGREQTCRFLPS